MEDKRVEPNAMKEESNSEYLERKFSEYRKDGRTMNEVKEEEKGPQRLR